MADALTQQFFYSIGNAINQWAYVDRALFGFCKFALCTTEEKTAQVFYKTPNISDHLVLADTLMKLSLPAQKLQAWEYIRKTTSDLLEFRNFIAHNPSSRVISTLDLAAPPKHYWEVRIEPSKLLRKRAGRTGAEVQEITNHAVAVGELLKQIDALQKSLPKRPAKSYKPASPQDRRSKRKGRKTRPRKIAKKRGVGPAE
jgi:hypothetical protein